MKFARSVLLMLTISIAGCAAAREKPILSAASPEQKIVCPELIGYTLALQQQVAAEMAAGLSPTLNQIVRDNTDTRDQIRVCKGLPVPARR